MLFDQIGLYVKYSTKSSKQVSPCFGSIGGITSKNENNLGKLIEKQRPQGKHGTI